MISSEEEEEIVGFEEDEEGFELVEGFEETEAEGELDVTLGELVFSWLQATSPQARSKNNNDFAFFIKKSSAEINLISEAKGSMSKREKSPCSAYVTALRAYFWTYIFIKIVEKP